MICVFSPVKFCSFNTLIYPSKKYNIDKGDGSGIVNIFNMFLKVQCRYKHMAWTTLLHLEHIVIALERMLGVVQRIQFRCFPFPKRTSLFLFPCIKCMLSKFLGKSPENANFYILHRMHIFYIDKIQIHSIYYASIIWQSCYQGTSVSLSRQHK